MTDRLPDRFGLVGPVDSVAVAQLEPAGPEHPEVPPGGGPERGNNYVSAGDDLPALGAAAQRNRATVTVASDYFAALGGDDAISGGNSLPGSQSHNAQASLVRDLHEVPVGRHPRRIFFLFLNHQTPARSFEAPLRAT